MRGRMLPDSGLMTTIETANYLGIHRGTLWRFLQEGSAPPAVLIGRSRRFRRADVDSWIESRRAVS